MESRPVMKAGRTIAALGLAALTALAQGGSEPSVSVSFEPDRQSVYRGEAFTLEVVIRAVGVRLGRNVELLEMPDASRLEVGAFDELPLQRRIVSGQIREVRRYRATARPLEAGVLTLAPRVRFTTLSRRPLFIGSTWADTPYTTRVDPVTVTVKPLPEAGRPASFSGAVGDFALEVSAAPTRLAVGDLITVTLRVTGRGYLAEADPPAVSAPRFRTYPPERTDYEAGRSATFTQVIIPLGTNAASIPPVTFGVFDPADEAYRTLRSDPIPLVYRARSRQTFDRYRPVEAPPRPDEARPSPAASRLERAVAWLKAQLGTRTRRVGAAADVRFAPRQAAPVLFTLDPGTPVRILETADAWVKIAAEGNRGWLRAAALAGHDEPSVTERGTDPPAPPPRGASGR
ncbi:MAG: BatD family protein [Lentisphaerae bacterium]|nr:BatD family protein [Lentisphaerota bacterium]